MKQPTTKKKKEPPVSNPNWLPLNDALLAGKAIRERVPRIDHAVWKAPADRIPAVEQLNKTLADYLPHLVPVRYGRMLQSSFSFFRGSAAIMANDLASTPNSGIIVQSCGDCHLLNFGSFATPERKIIFDLNDFDETLPAPWEWDLKRLTASLIIASRHNGFSENDSGNVVMECVNSYRNYMEKYASMSPLEAWYESITAEELFQKSKNEEAKKRYARQLEKAKYRYEHGEDFPNMTEVINGKIRIKDSPPLVYHPNESNEFGFEESMNAIFQQYVESLSEEKRPLLNQYHYQDIAAKVVGIGSVGKVCAILLLLSADGDPLFLQVKEARTSVLEAFKQETRHENDGQRVVLGQKLMQSASDIFLGWCIGRTGKHFYFRQLRDMKVKPTVEVFDVRSMTEYASLCGWALARAHSRSGKSALIAGYIGKSDKFLKSMSQFAIGYARQNENDYASLKKAVSDGTVDAFLE